MIIKSFVKTLSGSDAQALSNSTVKAVNLGCFIYAEAGDTVYIGGAGVTSDTGFLLPTTPGTALRIGDIVNEADGMIDLTKTYVVGSDGDKVRVLYLKTSTMV